MQTILLQNKQSDKMLSMINMSMVIKVKPKVSTNRCIKHSFRHCWLYCINVIFDFCLSFFKLCHFILIFSNPNERGIKTLKSKTNYQYKAKQLTHDKKADTSSKIKTSKTKDLAIWTPPKPEDNPKWFRRKNQIVFLM